MLASRRRWALSSDRGRELLATGSTASPMKAIHRCSGGCVALLPPCSLGLAWRWAGSAPPPKARQGPLRSIFIAQIVVLMLVGRLLGEAMMRLRQPAVMGQLIAGLLLGPSFFGLLLPDAQHALFPKNPEQKAMIDGDLAVRHPAAAAARPAWRPTSSWCARPAAPRVFASLMGIVIPFVCGVALGEMLPDACCRTPASA